MEIIAEFEQAKCTIQDRGIKFGRSFPDESVAIGYLPAQAVNVVNFKIGKCSGIGSFETPTLDEV